MFNIQKRRNAENKHARYYIPFIFGCKLQEMERENKMIAKNETSGHFTLFRFIPCESSFNFDTSKYKILRTTAHCVTQKQIVYKERD